MDGSTKHVVLFGNARDNKALRHCKYVVQITVKLEVAASAQALDALVISKKMKKNQCFEMLTIHHRCTR